MSREIKFRAWKKQFENDDDVQGMYYTDQGEFKIIWMDFRDEQIAIEIDYFETEFGNSPDIEIFDIEDFELMQNTGLKDANGNAIWEGDICYDAYSEEYGRVYEDEGSYVFEHEGIIELLSETHQQIEIVGNIHENKELLKDEE